MSSRRRAALPNNSVDDDSVKTTTMPLSTNKRLEKKSINLTLYSMMGFLLMSSFPIFSAIFRSTSSTIDPNVPHLQIERKVRKASIKTSQKTTTKSVKPITTALDVSSEKSTTIPPKHKKTVKRSPLTLREADFVYEASSSSKEKIVTKIYQSNNCIGSYVEYNQEDLQQNGGRNLCQQFWLPPQNMTTNNKNDEKAPSIAEYLNNHGGSIMVTGGSGSYAIDMYRSCQASGTEFDRNSYLASVFPLDGCTVLRQYESPRHLKVVPNPITNPAYQPSYHDKNNHKKYHGVVSVESNIYFYYQVLAGMHSWETTGNSRQGRFTRISTMSEPDDMTHLVPTFTAPRHVHSWRYRPFNKADALVKWFASPSAPQEDVVVVMDADNWLTQDLSPLVEQVRPGHALGNRAFYTGQDKLLMQVWHEVCQQPHNMTACDQQLTVPVDLVAVPYFVHREDLKMIVPRWKQLIKDMHDKVSVDKDFENRYMQGFQINWCVEMLAYNFAAAEAGVKHDIQDVQRRDVDGPIYPFDMTASNKTRERDVKRMNEMYMIHMGRAWFPTEYEPGQQWAHTEGKQISRGRGTQVWCKCNFTAAAILPWPLPTNKIDFVSNVTLTLLHEVNEKHGLIPASKYRKKGQNGSDPTEIHYYYQYP
mmetsp:Transcript_14669/g.22913  ORF Transcript_14669/g.22913 Transcript_14669/m.22913 type:complete len:646 (+) Transcript_14669:224-2161(+)